MPIERRVRPGGGRLRLIDIDLHDILWFSVGWHPPTTEFERSRSRWTTYQEYLAEWQQVREECLHGEDGNFCGPDRDGWHFAERLLEVFGPDGPPALLSENAIRDALR